MRTAPRPHREGLTPPQPIALLGLRPAMLIPRALWARHEAAPAHAKMMNDDRYD